jgi:hypothetical protein
MTQYLRILYLSITKDTTKFEENDVDSVFKIPTNIENYMGYVLTWITWSKISSPSSGTLTNFCNIVENTFNEKNMDEFYEINASVSKIKRCFTKILRLWKWKRAKIYNIEDLCMNTIYSGQKNTVTILKNNMKYVFSLKDLICNFNSELSNIYNLFVQPLPCKNPYTNECFNKSDLYNIYFAICDSTFLMPKLIHEYFLMDFCLSRYMNENDYMIKEYYAEKYVNKITNDIVLKCTNDMFREHNILSIKINKEFPKQLLKELMTPYLKLYYLSKFSQNKMKKAYSFMKLHKILHNIMKDTPNFGRKRYISILNGNNKKRYLNFVFNTKLPEIKIVNDFMTDHLHLKITEYSYIMANYQNYETEMRNQILNRMMPPRYTAHTAHTGHTGHIEEEMHVNMNVNYYISDSDDSDDSGESDSETHYEEESHDEESE